MNKKTITKIALLYAIFTCVVLGALYCNQLYLMLINGTSSFVTSFNVYGEYKVELFMLLFSLPGVLILLLGNVEKCLNNLYN